jgi:hypothetical protein
MSCTDEVLDKDRDLMPQYQDLHVIRSAAAASSASQPDNRIMRR